ncbi:hypothetical protein ACFL4O_03650 [bacterium]
MKCPNCEMINKEDVKICKKCGLDLTIVSMWKPTFRWHIKALVCIYISLGILYIILRLLLG